MKIKQELIDNLADSDWTREKLAVELLRARYLCKKAQAEADWLDQLANLLREGAVGHDIIYQEYQDKCTDLIQTYRETNYPE